MGGFKFLGNNGFQSTLPRVERQRLFLYLDIPGNFNPRSREWSDPLKVAPLQVIPISIHAPASGATDIIGRDVRTVQFQSTLPRVERQLTILAYSFPCQISIHAPASGATVTSVNIKLSFHISIHAPASGATVNILKQNPNKVYFNPRSREWSDQESTDRVKCRTYFNPRSREWSDGIY